MKAHNIVWNENKTPVSTHFDDIYFSNDDAVEEKTYVFIEGNNLTKRFLTHTTSTFVIAETGFGSGLNFLLAWRLFLQFRQQNPTHILAKLCFLSIEKFPLTKAELTDIHQAILSTDTLAPLAEQLKLNWPSSSHLFKHDVLSSAVELNILFADINGYADNLKQYHLPIDCWFFDGFSPTKNPDMWSELLFSKLLTLTNPQGTFATYTAAGLVRRNLMAAGFIVQKRKGYRQKREMLIGYKPNGLIF